MKPKGLKEPISCPRMTDDQMKALEELVRRSPNVTEFGKKAVIYVLRKSENLTKPVCLILPEVTKETEGWVDGRAAEQMQNAVHNLISAGGRTRIDIDLVFHAMGTDFGLSSHSGGYIGGIFLSHPARTIWVSPYYYDDNAEKLEATVSEIKAAIDLSRDFYYLLLNPRP